MYKIFGFKDDVYLGRVAEIEFNIPKEGKYAYLLGNFNAFNEGSFRMRERRDRWDIRLELPEGVWYYMFSVEGEYRLDEDNPEVVYFKREAYKFGRKVNVARVLSFELEGCGENEICREALYHHPSLTYIYPFEKWLFIRFRALKGDLDAVFLLIDGERIKMRKKASDEVFDYYEAIIDRRDEVSYTFELSGGNEVFSYGDFDVRLEELFNAPDWIFSRIFYQIMPDRFARGGEVHEEGHYGGTLQGILKKMSYLSELGINALYLTPVFESMTYHGYDIVDYYHIARKLGGDSAFNALLKGLRERDIRLILDGVFHHTSFFHPYFLDVVNKGKNSPYREFYRILDFPVVPEEFLNLLGSKHLWSSLKKLKWNFESFFNVWLMPRLNHDNPNVREFILDVGKYWISRGADGWRLDVAHGVPPEVWKEFRRALPESVYLFGEVMDDARLWLFDKFHGVMNYLLYEALLRFFVRREMKAEEFLNWLELLSVYYGPHEYLMYNFLDNHDLDRFLSLVGDRDKYKCALVFLFTYKGIPSIYYGSEVGLENTDGGFMERSRAPMEWNESKWDNEILELTKKLIHLRKNSKALQRGIFKPVEFKDGFLLFERIHEKEKLLIGINYSENSIPFGEQGKLLMGEIDGGILEPFSFFIISLV